jgi:hypothetical protein
MPHSTSQTLKVIYAKGSANHREFDSGFYMSFNKIVTTVAIEFAES